MHPLILIVFLPIVAALIAGLGGRWIGKTAAKVVTTGSLFVGAILSWPIFFQYIAGDARPVVVPVLTWIQSGSLTVRAKSDVAVGLGAPGAGGGGCQVGPRHAHGFWLTLALAIVAGAIRDRSNRARSRRPSNGR